MLFDWRRLAPTGLAVLCLISAALPVASAGAAVKFGVSVLGKDSMDALGASRAATARVNRVRFAFDWSDVAQDNPTNFTWTYYDNFIRTLATNGLTGVPVLWQVPRQTAGNARPYNTCTYGNTCYELPTTTQSGIEDYDTFVKAVANRYGRINPSDPDTGQFWKANPSVPYRPIQEYQIWNEVNRKVNTQHGATTAPQMASAYAILLRNAQAQIKQVDPSAKIILAGMPSPSNGGVSYKAFMNAFYALGGVKNDFDIAAIHPYPEWTLGYTYAQQSYGAIQSVNDQTQAARDVLAQNNDANRRIWVTEVGIATPPAVGEKATQTQLEQAQFLYSIFYNFYFGTTNQSVDQVFWYGFQDICQDPQKWQSSAGLFTSDCAGRTAKTAWSTFSLWTSQVQ